MICQRIWFVFGPCERQRLVSSVMEIFLIPSRVLRANPQIGPLRLHNPKEISSYLWQAYGFLLSPLVAPRDALLMRVSVSRGGQSPQGTAARPRLNRHPASIVVTI